MRRGSVYALLAVASLALILAAMNTNIAKWGGWDENVDAPNPRAAAAADAAAVSAAAGLTVAINKQHALLRVTKPQVGNQQHDPLSGDDDSTRPRVEVAEKKDDVAPPLHAAWMLGALGDPEDHDFNYRVSVWKLCGRGFRDNKVETCYSTTDKDLGCKEFRERFEAMQSMYLLTGIFSLLAIIVAILDMGHVHKFGHYKVLLTFCALFIIATAISGMALAISSVREDFCHSDKDLIKWGAMYDQPDFEWGVAPFLIIGPACLGFLMLGIALGMPDRESTGWVAVVEA